MKAPTSTPATRARLRVLPEVLLQKFLHEYGYTHGPVIARAIVEDLLRTTESYYQEALPPTRDLARRAP